MRRIGTFEFEKEALQFWNYLKEKGVDSSLEKEDSQNAWSIWVADEDSVPNAQTDMDLFLGNPNDPKFKIKSKLKKPDDEIEAKVPKKTAGFKQFDLRKQWQAQDRKVGTYTLSIIIASVLFFLFSGMGNLDSMVNPLKIDSRIMEGQLWRLITPIFIHFGPLHIFFNMWWLYDLGTQIEKRKGAKFFITFVLILAAVSNFCEFLYIEYFLQPHGELRELTASGAMTMTDLTTIGGMSGVIFGLGGYVWIKCKLDPADGFRLDPTIALIMFAFFLLGFTGIFDAYGTIANFCHAGGLIVGIAWGYASAYKWNRG